MAKKPKFEPSAELERMLLELAGVQVPKVGAKTGGEEARSASDPGDLCKQAAQLKRAADKSDGPVRFLIYLRSGLRYLEFAGCSNDKLETKIALLCETAKMFEYAAMKSASTMRPAIESRNIERLKDYAHLSYLSFRLAAVARMQRFFLKTDKLKRFWDTCRAFNKKKRSAERVRQANAASGLGNSAGLMIREDELRQDELHRDYVIEEGDDALLAMESWKEADKLWETVRGIMGPQHSSRLDSVPIIQFSTNLKDLAPLATHVRKALDGMY